ncbi:hypothetical protein BDM02DRAFT_1562337 [Thelephora ganbajun]|uniref:Uncharacterized protein n=1 Tax=Thelephora ganbajun TaxID=370292 RepID=A0ACB6ZV56_THEGA|nr:hypothetical protein BDM02DRAFT_1562337 [Thelephora ganbajun]
MAKNAKRQRKNETNDVADDTKKSIPLIMCLPFELIAEILLYSKSPADVLSLSQTCKHFCATLVQNPVASFIWKRVRAQTTPPVPDPVKLGFSEPQLANFIYGGGNCTVCGKSTNNMYKSFSARVRFCGDPECHLKHSSVLHRNNRHHDLYIIPQYASWLPWIEWPKTGEAPTVHRLVITNGQVLGGEIPITFTYDYGQLLQARNEYNKAALSPATLDEYKLRKQKYVDGLENWMNGCLELCRWKWNLRRLQRITTMHNTTQVEEFAADHGRDKDDVRCTPTIARLLREKLHDFQEITRSDLEALRPEVEVDLARIGSHRKNVGTELSHLRRCREVERLYRELDHIKFDCFPSLPQFRKLPTLRAFRDSTLDVESTGWRNEFVDNLIKNETRQWAAKTVQAFSERLGYPQWPPTDILVHPVHRISTRFTCTRCSKSGPKAARNKSLTFREAAHHICLVPEKGNKDQWSPQNFVADVKAAAAITRFVAAVGMDVQEKTVAESVNISRDIMCLSCSAPIVMGFDAIIQHSHRHDDMQFMILADEELSKFSDYPVTPGVTAQLMRTGEQTKEWRSKSYFGCKHCIPNPLANGETEASSDKKAPKPRKKSKAFTFDGLRCHLKEKHKVIEVADEDLFVFGVHLKELGYKD